MSLSEQDKADLLGLTSGFGTRRSRARARRLARTDPQATTYLRQVEYAGRRLVPPCDEHKEEEKPAPVDVDAIVEAAMQRAGEPDPRGTRPRRRWILPGRHPYLSAAAVLLVIVSGVWLAVASRSQEDWANDAVKVLMVPGGGGHLGFPAPNQIETRLGDRIDSKTDRAKVFLSPTTSLILPAQATIATTEKRDEVVLETGAMLVVTDRPVRVHVRNAVINVISGKVLVGAGREYIDVSVYEGRATTTLDGADYILPPGQRLRWYPGNTAHTSRLRHEELPPFTRTMLEAQPLE